MNYTLWKLGRAIQGLVDPEHDIPNDAPYYRTNAHITWIESKGKYGCPGATNHACPHFKRGCHSSDCEHTNVTW